MENQNLPATTNHVEIATGLVQKYRGQQDLVFVSDEELRTQAMFFPEIVAVHAEPGDFHKIGQKFMPKKHIVDRIAEAAGITFLEQNCGTRTETVEGATAWIGFAQGKKRMPDGTWRTSSVCEYEFSPVIRAEEDFLKDSQREPGKQKYNNEVNKKLLIITYKKYGRARANTGARLRTIHELTGMQTSFEAGQLKRALVYSRVAVNTDLLLADPKTREVALEAALGITRQIYGPPKEEPKALSDHYTVEDGTPDQGPPPGDKAQKHEDQSTGDMWGKSSETEEQKKTCEMADDLRKRRMEYSKELSGKALIEIDNALSDPIDPKLINIAIENLDAWESWRAAQQGGK